MVNTNRNKEIRGDKNMWKKMLKKTILLSILIIIYIYIIAIDAIPNQIVIFEGENIKVNSMMGLGVKEEEPVATNMRNNKYNQNKKIKIKFI